MITEKQSVLEKNRCFNKRVFAWDFNNSCLAETKVSAITNYGRNEFRITNLGFSNGKEIDVVECPAFYDTTVNKFVTIDADNASDFIGHTFVFLNDKNETVFAELLKANCEVRSEDSYSIFTDKYVNAFANSVLTLSPSAQFLYPFDIDDNMKFNQESIQSDIEKYGILIYEEFSQISKAVTMEQFYGLNAQYMKIAIGKGITTMEDVLSYASILANDSLK